MAEIENPEVFLPLTLKTYKESKINLLKTKLKIISSHDRIKRLNELQKLKTEQRRELKKRITRIKQSQNQIQKDLPTQKEIKIFGKALHQTSKNYPKKEQLKPTYNSKIDDELEKIQERIRKLNL